MNHVRIVLLFACCCFLVNCATDDYEEIEQYSNEIFLTVDSLLRLNNWTVDTVQVLFDHPRKQVNNYEGVAFLPILLHLQQKYQLTDQVLLSFICKDGYVASNTLETLLSQSGGYIVWRDMHASEAQKWPDSAQHFAPYYLTWDSIPYGDHTVVWPYGWTNLQIQFDDPYKSLVPSNNKLIEGFELYKKHCIKCHSLNGLGGDLGPEFNIPMNITEYWNRKLIVRYVQNPQSVRLHSKMYPITSMNARDINQVIDYLEYIRNYKDNGNN